VGPGPRPPHETRRRRLATAAGAAGLVIGGAFGYDIGSTIASPWLGAVMALNGALFTGIVAALACDRLLRRLERR
jgi:hypothetical protein